MNEVTITQILGTVEITDGGKKIPAKKGTKISIEAKIKTGSNAKVELEVNGQTYMIPNDQNITVKDIIKAGGGGSDPTQAAGVRG
jgi:hypothetical protein